MTKCIRLCIFVLLFFYSYILYAREYAVIPRISIVKNKLQAISGSASTTISRQQLQDSGSTTLPQALQNWSDIQLHDTSGNGSQVLIGMRGFGANASSNTLMLINGIPITNPDLAPPDLNSIPLQQIEYIEVINGSESIIYGDQAVGGIINIVTRSNAKEAGELSCNAGSYNQRACFGIVHLTHDTTTYNLSASLNHSDNYREHNQYDQGVVFGDLSHQYSAGIFKFDFKSANENMQYPGALTASQVFQNRRQASSSTNYFSDSSHLFHAQDNHILSDNINLVTDLAQRQMHGHGILFSPFTQSRMGYFIKPQLSSKIDKTTLTSGLDYQSDSYYLNSAYGLTEDNQQKISLFSMINLAFTQHTTIIFGARGALQNSKLNTQSQYNTINRAFVSNVGINHQISDKLHLYLRRAGNYRFPKADENAQTPPNVHGLKTQSGVAYETGVEYNAASYSGKLNLFQLNLIDEIAYDPFQTPTQPFGTNRNLPPTSRYGLSLAGRRSFEHIILGGQYNYVNARIRNGINAGNRIPLVSENVLRADSTFRFSEHWSSFVEGIFTGNQYPANDDANISEKNGGYTTYNFALNYKTNHLHTSFRINNIFNKYYYFYTVYQTDPIKEFYYPAPTRNFTLTFRYTFD